MEKDLWDIEVGDTLLLEDDETGKVVDISNVRKPDPFVIIKDDAGELWEIRGNVHNDTMFEIVK